MIRYPLLALMIFAGCTPAPKPDDDKKTDDSTVVVDEDGDGFLISEGDCDDSNPEVNPGETEICNSVDDDCDDTIDEDVQGTYYKDFDGDGFGDPDASQVACEAPDGYVQSGTDCDDQAATTYPGAEEICDDVDNNCNGTVDEGVTYTWYADADGDGHGDLNAPITACTQPAGTVDNSTDCDDTMASAFPGNAEVCDEVDNNCDGTVDEGVTTTFYADFDGDSFGAPGLTQEACAVPSGYTTNADDCDDSQSAVNPRATEVCNGYDDNCDGSIDEGSAADAPTWYADVDGDAYGNASSSMRACAAPAGYVSDATDCDDGRALTNPGATEYCNSFDDDCDGTTDENSSADAATWYIDSDSDAYGNAAVSTVSCSAPSGYVADATDCNDGSNRAYPGATEYCDTIDNDCDATVDEDSAVDARTWYADSDSDTYGNASVSDVECTAPSGYVANATDCDDARAATYPGAPEYCNSHDDDCDGTVDENDALDAGTYYVDGDADGYGSTSSMRTCTMPSGYTTNDDDCDDARAATYPGAPEYCNSIDDDCDGTVDENSAVDATTWYYDADRDGYGSTTSSVSCTAPSGYVSTNTDCLDTSAISYPGAAEICDSLDNDCDGTVDDNVTDGNTYYADDDSDGFGDPSSTISECALPSGYAENAYDCDDSDRTEPVVADAMSGSAAGTGTIGSPFDSLQDAIDAANTCVIAYSGTYLEQIDLGGKSIDVWGVEGEDVTTIDANMTTCSASNPTACGAAVTIDSGSNATPVIHGFSITGGTGAYTASTSSTTCADSSASHSGRTTCTVYTYEYCGGGVFVSGDDPEFYDVIIRDNVLPDFEQTATGTYAQTWMYSFGGGVCLQNSNATFATTVIEGNYADQGGGIFAEASSNFSFSEGYVSENDATDGGGVNLSGASASFSNSILHCNAADTDGGGLYTETSGTATFTNTVLYGNTSSTSGSARGSQAYIATSTTFNLYNSIVQASTTVPLVYGAGGSGTQTYNNVYNGSGSGYGGSLSAGSGAISANPQFTSVSCDGNAYNDTFTLRTGSTSINAGDPAAGYNDADGTRNDMGAYGGPNSTWSL